MRYKKYYENIMSELQAHKNNIDALAKSYKAEKANFESSLAGMKGKYTDEYIAETRKNWKPKLNYSQQLDDSRIKHGATVDFYISAIEKQLNKYFNAPIKREFADKITTIKLSGLQLSDMEFKLLQKEATTYMERRLLNELAVTRTKKSEVRDMEKGRKIIDAPDVYALIELPNVEQTYNAFNSFATQCRFMIKNYSGENIELFDYLGNGTPDYISISADTIFKNDTTRNNFLNTMEKAVSIMPQPKQALTEQDTKLIDAIIDPKYPSIAENQVKEIAKNSPELEELLRLDTRYNKFLEGAEE